MRLAVNQRGDRMDHPATVHDINVLTVVASESYKDFVAALQKDFSESLSARPQSLPEIDDDRKSRGNPRRPNPEPEDHWTRADRMAAYSELDADDLVQKAITALNDKDTGLQVTPLHYTIQHGEQADAAGTGIKIGNVFALQATETEGNRASAPSSVKYDLIGKLSEGTHLSSWSFADVQAKIAYKTRLSGGVPVWVDADYTSQGCPICGHAGRENRPHHGLLFGCARCGHTLHADLVAARNISMRTLLVRQDWARTGRLSAAPEASGDEAKAARLQRYAELRWSLDASPAL